MLYRWLGDTGDLSNKRRHLRPEGAEQRCAWSRRRVASCPRLQHRWPAGVGEELWREILALFRLLSHCGWDYRGGTTRGGCWAGVLGGRWHSEVPLDLPLCPANEEMLGFISASQALASYQAS